MCLHIKLLNMKKLVSEILNYIHNIGSTDTKMRKELHMFIFAFNSSFKKSKETTKLYL